MSATIESNKVSSYLISFTPKDNYTFQEGLEETFTVKQPFLKRASNKVDTVYSWDHDKALLFVQVFKPLARSALLGYDSTIMLLGSENAGMTLLLEGRENTLFNTLEYLFSEIRKESEERLLFVSCFETVGTTLVDYVGNYLGDSARYSYSVSKTSISLLRVEDTGKDMQIAKKIVSEERRNRKRQFVVQVLVTSNSHPESGEYFLSGISFILFSDCDSVVERLSQLSSLKIDPCSEPSRVLFYPFSTQNVNELILDLVCSALGGNRLGAILVLANLQDLSRNVIESLLSFASSLCRVENNPTQSILKLRVSLNSHREVVSHPRLNNLDSRLNEAQLEIDQAKYKFGVTRTRRPTPSSATWKSFLKSLKIMPSGESYRSNPTSPALSPTPSPADELEYASRNQYSENASEDGRDLRYIHLASRESTFHKCFKCCLPKAVFNEFRSIFDVSESP
ncbi:hypothetical protein Gasu_38410 isoform 1 [Galdieria sulphuraria]|uniref:Kinesin motor domain-containing protein n=1 Tax=Galdieria sulphuraria TaxID=130081 RepID=M2VZ77_GALSU|nr:hypothetical protein Gasu_38410 isoform 1 [Galdieria sulphuraria]EME28631.1 hypothetical protein isoform 1 [Galdieria sulphuraria]|eukprot:XP_005705151.1 hypothetical protein isoform 1 [Galdieria sulphuraria]